MNLRKPAWLKINLNSTANTMEIRRDLRERNLHTVCEAARCPNLHECWSRHRTATFMILGNTCTRACRFCGVKTGKPEMPDSLEPTRVAASIEKLGIRHAVITMVNRDDLPDGGAEHLAATGRAIKNRDKDITVEYLSSDMMGIRDSIATLVDSAPEILGHNVETVRRLKSAVQRKGDYELSLNFLKTARSMNHEMLLKSSIMLGLGEVKEEIIQTLADLRQVGCNLLSIGQYLQPGPTQLPVKRYWQPAEFVELMKEAEAMGFEHVEAGPLVRSSYHSEGQLAKLLRNWGGS